MKLRRNGRSILSVTLPVIFMVIGLGLALYPTVADMINQAENDRVIDEYRLAARETGEEDYERIISAVTDYNRKLAEQSPYIEDLTPEKKEIYDNLLNIAGNGIIGYIKIPKAGICLAIYHGTDESVLQTGVGHLEGSSLPARGESVHTVLTGHSGLPSANLFTDIDRLDTGDTFTLHVLRETLTYRVEQIRRVKPESLKELHIEKGEEICTLMTCTPYGVNTHRLVVKGRLLEKSSAPGTENKKAGSLRIFTSTWHRWFFILPVTAFAGITAAGVILYVKIKRKRDIHARNKCRK